MQYSEPRQDSQHIYLNSLVSLLRDDLASLRTLIKTNRISHTQVIEKLILGKTEIAKVLGYNLVGQNEGDDDYLNILNNSNFNLIEYLLETEINQEKIILDILKMLNYSKEKQILIAELCNRNISLLKSRSNLD